MLGSKNAAAGGFSECFQVVRSVPFRRTNVVMRRAGERDVGYLLFRSIPRPGSSFRTILKRGEKIGKLEGRSCHRGEDRYVCLLQVAFDVAQAISAVVVAAVRDDNDSSAFVERLAFERGHAGVNSIKKRSAAIGWRKQRRESPLKVLLIAGEGREARDTSFNAEQRELIAEWNRRQVWIEYREGGFLHKWNFFGHAGAEIGENHEGNRLALPFARQYLLLHAVFLDEKVALAEICGYRASIVEDRHWNLHQL